MKHTSSSKIQNLIVLEPDIFYDFRGENCETFNQKDFDEICVKYNLPKLNFLVDSFSFSRKNTLRGFHGDEHTWKLIQCLYGSIQFVVIDLKRSSPTYKQHEMFYLNDRTKTQILIPEGCVNAHLCITDKCIFGYKLSNQYVVQENQLHVLWNDPDYNIDWVVKTPILSKRDSSY